MIILPDGKVCNNLREQVAENLKKIQEIIHFLDGVNIQDNLVVIADLSQILTAAELETVERPVAFIYYNAELYIKKNEAAGVAYFVNVFSIEDTGTQLNFNSHEIQVNLGTGALTYTTATATSYTKSQIDSLLALKANDAEVAKLTGAAFTGAITGPSIIEDMTGYSFIKNTSQDNTMTKTYNYAGAVKNGNKLTLVISFTLDMITGFNANSAVYLGTFKIPTEIGQKLFPYTQGAFTDVLDYKFILLSDSSSTLASGEGKAFITKSNDTTLVAFVYPTSNLESGKKYNGRIEATFLLSNNLAS